MAGLLSVFAEFEREVLRERILAGLAQARRRGTHLGRPRSAAQKEAEVRKLFGQASILPIDKRLYFCNCILPANLPRQEGIAINTPVLLFTLAATVIVALSLGLFAGWRATVGDLRNGLAAASQSYSGTSASHRFRAFLVTGEIAATLVILVGAGLLGRSFLQLISTSPGFRSQNLITAEFSLPIPQA